MCTTAPLGAVARMTTPRAALAAPRAGAVSVGAASSTFTTGGVRLLNRLVITRGHALSATWSASASSSPFSSSATTHGRANAFAIAAKRARLPRAAAPSRHYPQAGAAAPSKERARVVTNATSFHELGLDHELVTAMHELNLYEPTDIQAAAIPQILAGGHFMVASHTVGGAVQAAYPVETLSLGKVPGWFLNHLHPHVRNWFSKFAFTCNFVPLYGLGSGKTLTYLLPVVQQLRREEALTGARAKPKRPRVLIVGPTRELAEQVRDVAKHVSHHARFSSELIIGGDKFAAQREKLNRPLVGLYKRSSTVP
jgi:hypothetical protein